MTKIRTAEEHLAHLEKLYVKLVHAGGDPEEIDTLRQLINGYRSNGIENPDRPTPGTAITRVLEAVGLKRGEHFRVTGYWSRRDGRKVKVAVRVTTWDEVVEGIIADNKKLIEQVTWGMGRPFSVTVHWTRSQQPVTYVSHMFGKV
jgi:hypothetical protein